MDEPQSSSNAHGITHACIRFRNQRASEYNIVPIDFVKVRVNKSLKSYEPKDDSDFVKDKFYYVLIRDCLTRSTEDNEDAAQDLYYKAHVLHLGESENSVKNKIVDKRVRFPNKKYCDNSSSTEIEGPSKSSLQQSKLNQKKFKERIDKRKTDKAEEELQRFYGKRHIDNRKKVVDSDSDGVESVQTEPEDFQRQKTTKHSTSKKRTTTNEPTNINNNKTLENEEHEHEENNNFRGEEHEDQNNSSITPREVAHNQETRRILRPLSFPTTSGRENITIHHLEHLTNVAVPERLEKRKVMEERITTERHGLRRFDIVNGKLYLGLDAFVGREIWSGVMAQTPTTFIRDTATIIWGPDGVMNRCFDITKVSVTFAGRSPRKEFEANKLQLLRELLEHYLDEHRYFEREKTRHKRNLNNILARYVQDLRKPYKDLVRKRLVFEH